jgi:hypothetical protein
MATWESVIFLCHLPFFQTWIVERRRLMPEHLSAFAPPPCILPWWTCNHCCPHEPPVIHPPKPAIEGRVSFPTHGIHLHRHRRKHLWLPHPGECHKWVLLDLPSLNHQWWYLPGVRSPVMSSVPLSDASAKVVLYEGCTSSTDFGWPDSVPFTRLFVFSPSVILSKQCLQWHYG